jgi:hypothetical protein
MYEATPTVVDEIKSKIVCASASSPGTARMAERAPLLATLCVT